MRQLSPEQQEKVKVLRSMDALCASITMAWQNIPCCQAMS